MAKSSKGKFGRKRKASKKAPLVTYGWTVNMSAPRAGVWRPPGLATRRAAAAVTVVGKEMTPDGRDRWVVTDGSKIVNLTTSSSSTAIMQQATVIYADTLKRLADS
jgi:hypothetical protein